MRKTAEAHIIPQYVMDIGAYNGFWCYQTIEPVIIVKR